MKTWDQFYPHIASEVIGCPNPLIDNALRMAAREFCAMTGAIREWSDPITASGTNPVFEFDLPIHTELVGVVRSTVNTDDYDVISYREMPADWHTANPASIGNKIVQIDSYSYRVFPAPNAGDLIRLMISTKPTMTATGCVDDLFNRYPEEVCYGAKARLMMSRGHEWSDMAMASVYSKLFNGAISSASNEDFGQRSRLATKKQAL